MRKWMEQGEIGQFLAAGKEGVLALAGGEFPYAVPLNYVSRNGKLYFHCAAHGEKLDRLRQNPCVCFTVYGTDGFAYDKEAEFACGVHTLYASVIVRGTAQIVEDPAQKKEALAALVLSLAPEMAGKPMREASLQKTAVVEITPQSVTGKAGR